jgi:hypothetical protein
MTPAQGKVKPAHRQRRNEREYHLHLKMSHNGPPIPPHPVILSFSSWRLRLLHSIGVYLRSFAVFLCVFCAR